MDWTNANDEPIKTPIGKLWVITLLMLLLPPTLPIHFAKWFFDGEGLLDRGPDGRHYNYKPIAPISLGSLAALIVLAVIAPLVALVTYAALSSLFLICVAYVFRKLR